MKKSVTKSKKKIIISIIILAIALLAGIALSFYMSKKNKQYDKTYYVSGSSVVKLTNLNEFKNGDETKLIAFEETFEENVDKTLELKGVEEKLEYAYSRYDSYKEEEYNKDNYLGKTLYYENDNTYASINEDGLLVGYGKSVECENTTMLSEEECIKIAKTFIEDMNTGIIFGDYELDDVSVANDVETDLIFVKKYAGMEVEHFGIGINNDKVVTVFENSFIGKYDKVMVDFSEGEINQIKDDLVDKTKDLLAENECKISAEDSINYGVNVRGEFFISYGFKYVTNDISEEEYLGKCVSGITYVKFYDINQ